VSLVRKTLKTTATRADPVSEKMQEKAQVLDKIRGALWGCEQNNRQVRKQAPVMPDYLEREKESYPCK